MLQIQFKDFGESLAQRRRTKALAEGQDIKQADVARAVGIATATMNQYEAGKAMPSVLTIYKLALYYGTSIDDLVAPFVRRTGASEDGR